MDKSCIFIYKEAAIKSTDKKNRLIKQSVFFSL